MKVLVVDDSQYMIEALELLLKGNIVEVHSANSSRSALEILNKHIFDLIITDINMPGMSGIDLSFEIRKKYPLIPIILFTGQMNKLNDYKSDCDKIGNVHYIENKDVNALIKILSTILPMK